MLWDGLKRTTCTNTRSLPKPTCLVRTQAAAAHHPQPDSPTLRTMAVDVAMAPSEKMGRDDVVSQETVDAMIGNGDVIVVFEDYVLKLNSWMSSHPGGRLAILHMVGRDATDEITS